MNGHDATATSPSTAPVRRPLQLAAGSLDAVFTDPPYFGNVQYGELMDFCYAWLRQLVGKEAEGFDRNLRAPPTN